MLPPAPGRLSITIVWPSPSESRVARRRAMVSLAPPGAKPSTTRIGRSGYFCCAIAAFAAIMQQRMKVTFDLLSMTPPCQWGGESLAFPGPVQGRHSRIRGDRMKQQQRIRGVLSPVVTPFSKDLSPDAERFIAQCRWLLTQNCGLAVFGSNSEANSLSASERFALLDSLVAAHVDPARMLPGTGCCALTDTVRLTELAGKAGCAGV